jgi:murein DD-endopeptidase MepM/ murein hydrolase activator NlpD
MIEPPAAVAPIDTGAQHEQERSAPTRFQVTSYIVAQGDNLEEIARRHSIDVDTIRGANPELGSEVIQPGQQLNILSEKGVLHIVKAGQTFWSIARQYGLDWQKIRADNPEMDVDALQPGQKLFIRGGKPHSDGDVSRGSTDLSFRWPTKGVVSSLFGYRWGALHTGIDIAADGGDGIYAARGGRVTFAGWMGGYGLAIVVDHGRGWETLYGHASELFVTSGDVVQVGQCIAAVGNTGNSTGPHLHFEVRNQGIPKNPILYLF